MKLRFMFKVSQKAGAAARWVEHKRARGFCTVVAIKCRWCGVWVKADDWDPRSNVCDVCTVELRRAGVLGPHRVSSRKVRRNAGVK